MKNLDLNLLPQLQILLELRNISRTAERLQLSQPAVSASLAKLRRHFDDPLLVRHGRSYELSPFAQSLVPVVDEALVHIQRASRIRSTFDPSASEREFVIAASDYATSLMIQPLRAILAEEAPNVAVNFIQTSRTEIQGELSDFAKIDLLVGPMGYHMKGAKKAIFRDDFVAIADSGNDLFTREKLTLEDLTHVPMAVGYFGEGIMTPADKIFEDAGLKRRATATVRGYLSLPLLVEGTDLVALVPGMLAARTQRTGRISVLRFHPDHEASLVESMYWHPSQTEDPANIWLRSVLQRACASLHELFTLEAHSVLVTG